MLLIINIWFALEVIFEDNVFIWRLGLQSKCQEGCLCLFCRKGLLELLIHCIHPINVMSEGFYHIIQPGYIIFLHFSLYISCYET